MSLLGRTLAIPGGKNSGVWESCMFFDYLFYSAGLFLMGTPALPFAVGQLPQAPLLLRAAGLLSFHFLWISGLLMWKWNCVHACAVKCARLWLFSSLFWPMKCTWFFLVLPQIYQTLWSVSYGLSVRLHCLSSGSVEFIIRKPRHIPWLAVVPKGWGNTLPHDRRREWSRGGGRWGQGRVLGGEMTELGSVSNLKIH